MKLSSHLSIRSNFVQLLILIPLCLVIVMMSNVFGAAVNVGVIALIFFFSFFFLSYRYPRYNVLILLICNFFVSLLIKVFKLYELPFGIANEAFCAVMLLTLTLNKRISGLKTLPGILLIFWLCYELIELANPYANSREASLYSIRSLIPFISIFFIMYSSMETRRDANIFLRGWLILGLCAALYGIYQEFVGLPGYDNYYITMDETLYNLFVTWGRVRKFSFFFNPSEFGMLMSITAVSGFIIFFFEKELPYKILAGASSFFCIWAMFYTGSRTAMVILPLGLAIFTAITLHPKVLIAVGVVGVIGAVMILRPQSGAMYVMSTAFSTSEDPSMNLRIKNREMIRSYIISNPIGYGLGATGFLGKKYSANTFIGTFDTDSEYVRIAVEAGWVGLFLWCVISATIFGYGINVYFKTQDPVWKAMVLVSVVFVFMILVAEYVQELFVSPILPILLSCVIALIAKVDLKITRPEKVIAE